MKPYSKPILKWAGGKTQLLDELAACVPSSYGTYIEPFFGGGALFFALAPQQSVISDSNPELINLYKQIALDVESVIEELKRYENSKECFYEARSLDWRLLSSTAAAARTLYLNKTCFNGLYRVNKRGCFNVPFGNYKNPCICDEEVLVRASEVLQRATIVCGDFETVLEKYASSGDFIFLDPPYVPVSQYSDFKRYTSEQFGEADHRRLSAEVMRLREMGCHIVLTNSNHPLVHDLYGSFKMTIHQTKRHISCNGARRRGEDVVVVA